MPQTTLTGKEEDSFWAENSFAETMGSNDLKLKQRTFHMKHNEEMNYNAKTVIARSQHITKIGMPVCVINASIRWLVIINTPFKSQLSAKMYNQIKATTHWTTSDKLYK